MAGESTVTCPWREELLDGDPDRPFPFQPGSPLYAADGP